MPRQNRVTPDGTLIAVPDRGLFWGNRGALHDPAGRRLGSEPAGHVEAERLAGDHGAQVGFQCG